MHCAHVRNTHAFLEQFFYLIPWFPSRARRLSIHVHKHDQSISHADAFGKRNQTCGHPFHHRLVPEIIIGTQKANPLSTRMCQSLVPCVVYSVIRLRNPITEFVAVFFQYGDRTICRSSVDDDQFLIGVGLPNNTVDAFAQSVLAVEYRNNSRYQGHGIITDRSVPGMGIWIFSHSVASRQATFSI